MHAYIYFGEKSSLRSLVSEFIKDYKKINIRHFEIKKVQDVKDLIRETNFSFRDRTIYIIEDFDEASVVAQNAFLKRLEEPQENLTFLLTATKQAKVLDTILSRCVVKHIASQKSQDNTETLWGLDINSQFSLIDKIKTREEARVLLENMLSSSEKVAIKTKFVIETLERIEKNANTGLQLANLVVKLNS